LSGLFIETSFAPGGESTYARGPLNNRPEGFEKYHIDSTKPRDVILL